jgi:hypothetical protein
MLAAPAPQDYDMPVQPASLEILEKADVPPAQARAIVQAIEIEIAGAKETLATRQDVLILRHETSQLGTELRHEMAEMRTQLRHEMQELGARLESRIARVETRMETRMDGLVTQRQLYGAILGQMAVLLGIAYFFVAHVSR